MTPPPSQAFRFLRYGPPDVLELREVPRPEPAEGRVVVRVRAASVNPLDWHRMRGLPYLVRLASGVTRPKSGRLGADLAGTVEAVGDRVTGFRPGDEVYGLTTGTFAEYVRVPGSGLAPKPANLTFAQAAAVPVAGLTALQGLRDHGRIRPGQLVLVNGAAGGVGTFAVQLAVAFGAEVTAVCRTRNVALVRSLGATRVVDYTEQDFSLGGDRYHLILDLVGNRSVADYRRVLTRTGTLVFAAPSPGNWLGPLTLGLQALIRSPFVRQRFPSFLAKPNQSDLRRLTELIEAGQVTPVIDRSYPLDQVPDAIRYLEQGHARGKVVITV